MDGYYIPKVDFDKLFQELTEIKKMVQKPSEKPENSWLDNQEVMQLLKISTRTLATLRKNGKLAFSKQGGKIRYRYTDVLKHIEANYNGKK
jgi:excisionase family DNA binding protein